MSTNVRPGDKGASVKHLYHWCAMRQPSPGSMHYRDGTAVIDVTVAGWYDTLRDQIAKEMDQLATVSPAAPLVVMSLTMVSGLEWEGQP